MTRTQHAGTTDPSHAPWTGRLLPMVAVLAATLLAAPAALAQQGKVTGRVIDKDGVAFGFADVFLEGEGSNYSETMLSEEDGSFSFSPVPPGTYVLYAYATGLVSQKTTGIIVSPGSIKTHNIQLTPADQAKEELVEVRAAELDFVDPTITGVQSVLGKEFLSKIPLQNKRIQDIMNLFPGVVRSGSSDSADISVGGGTSSQIGYRLNGASINDPLDGGARFDIPTASIEQFKLITTGFSSEYGEQSTGLAEIITKRGTNEFEFSYAVNFRDTRYGAQSISGLKAVQVFTDELFRAEGTILEGEMKRGFELLGVDETSTLADDNNPIPRHRVRHTISTGGPIIREKVFFHSTLETVADDYGNAFVKGRLRNDQVLYTGKLNWDISKSNKAEASLSLDVKENDGFVGLRAPESVASIGSEGSWTLTLSDNHIFSPEAFLETRLTIAHDYEKNRPADEREGVGPTYTVPIPPGGPTSYFVGSPGVSFDETLNNIRLEPKYTRSFNLDNTSHTLEIGGLFSTLTFESHRENGPDVTDFRITEDTFTALQNPPNLMGRVLDYGPPVTTDDSTWSAAAFIQNKWLVTDNFTLDLGLRADYQEFVGELFFAPRVGFSLDPIGDRKTAFRGNWGIYYDSIFANALQWVQNPDLFYSDIYFADAFARRKFSETPITDIYKEALVTGFDSPDPDAVAYLLNLTNDRYRLGENLSAPTNKQWSFEVQRALPARMNIRVNYTENKRTKQLREDVRTVTLPVRLNQFTVRDRILNTSGQGRYHAWSVALQKAFSESWEVNLSYTQSRNTGPIPPPPAAVDPNDVVSENGILGNDRTHVIKVQGHGKLPWNIDMSGDFGWNTGEPLSADILTAQGQTFRPFGRNTLRYPSFRALNFQLAKPFSTADGKLNMRAELSVFNVLNELNVYGGFGRFELPEGFSRNPQEFPPIRPAIVPTDIDVGRSAEIGLTISF